MSTKSEFMLDWTCSLCTYVNKAKDFTCCICGARKCSSTRRGRGRAQQLDQIVAQQIQNEITLTKSDDSRPSTPNNNNNKTTAAVVKSSNNNSKSPKASKKVASKVKNEKNDKKSSSAEKKASKVIKTQEKAKRKLPPKHANLDILNAQSISITVNGVTVQFNRFVESVGASNIKIAHSSDILSNNNNNSDKKTSEKPAEKPKKPENLKNNKPELKKQDSKNAKEKEKSDSTSASPTKASSSSQKSKTNPETAKNNKPNSKPDSKSNSGKSSVNNTPTKKRGVELVRTGSGSSNKTASSNERSPRAGTSDKAKKSRKK